MKRNETFSLSLSDWAIVVFERLQNGTLNVKGVISSSQYVDRKMSRNEAAKLWSDLVAMSWKRSNHSMADAETLLRRTA